MEVVLDSFGLGLRTVSRGVSLKPFTLLNAGGEAEFFAKARTTDELASLSIGAQSERIHTAVLGWGSNVLPSDDGVPGLTIVNLSSKIEISSGGLVRADCGAGFQELFLKTAQAGLAGLEFAVGIPGTVGGALVSNAGAYRSNVAEFLERIEIVEEGERRWVEPSYMRFSYRDSILRQKNAPQMALIRVELRLPSGERKAIYDEAREYQRQRISKQPAPASAGSFFKNVDHPALADSLPNLPIKLKQAKVIPAGYLIEAAGLKGYRHRGAMLSDRHANFILNIGGATASAIRELAQIAKKMVLDKFDVMLEEEVLYLGNWSRFAANSEGLGS